MIDLDLLAPDVGRIRADLEALSSFTDPDQPGWTRRVFSEPYQASRDWVRTAMREAGLETRVDPAGNTIGTLAGSHRAPALVTGSHTDTVNGGGRFDGVVGVLGAIEVVRRLRETGTRLRHDLTVVDFLGEEPNDFGVSCVGSRALTGQLDDYADQARADGRTLGQELESSGLSPARMLTAAWSSSDIHAFVELHIEQGPVLERTGHEIGVVTAIAGIERVLATFVGRADHAGTMPMADRRDALAAAAGTILTIEQIGCSGTNSVATVGAIESGPGASNVVPATARIWGELRSPSAEWLGAARRRVVDEIVGLSQKRGVEVNLEWLNDQDPVPTAPMVQDVIAGVASSLGHSWTAIPSGAGHDAAHIATLAPMGMIFVPSKAGRSHCPEEWTDDDSIGRGVHALAATLSTLDAQ